MPFWPENEAGELISCEDEPFFVADVSPPLSIDNGKTKRHLFFTG
jgi:hypothetical protein